MKEKKPTPKEQKIKEKEAITDAVFEEFKNQLRAINKYYSK